MWPWFTRSLDRRINRLLLTRQLGKLIQTMKAPPVAPSRQGHPVPPNMPVPGTPTDLTADQQKLVLGGEAAMWEELATANSKANRPPRSLPFLMPSPAQPHGLIRRSTGTVARLGIYLIALRIVRSCKNLRFESVGVEL